VSAPRAYGLLLALVATSLVGVASLDATPVTDWNVATQEVATAGGQTLPIPLSRTLAMVHLAIHDALNAIERRYEPYVHEARAEAGAVPDAAIAAAARDVLAGLIPRYGDPAQRAKATALLDAAYAAGLAGVPDGPGRTRGIAAGQAAAATMLALRSQDGAHAPAPYTPGAAPGQWRPHPNPTPAHPPLPDPAMAAGNLPAILPHWAQVTPFTMLTTSRFRLPPPPALASDAYARDYDEVKRLGAKQSPARTAQQSESVRYWYEGSPQGWNRIARVLVAQRALDRWEHARLFALINAAMADGFIAGADTRYLYNFWRPVTAIRAGDTDGNDATERDGGWESYVNTPALPDYPSTHSVLGAAAAAVLIRFFDADQIAFTMTSGPPFAGITRSFTSVSQAARENADSRVLGGIHFRSACQGGLALGEQIGRRAFAGFLQPYRR
jgi:PAP2 superfamily/Vanadium chloroperoxidase N-terminal domain